VEGQLRRAADGVGGLARVLHARQLDDDPGVARAREGRLRDAERVDALAQHLDHAVGRLGVGADGAGVARLQDDLGAAPQVEAEPHRAGERHERGGDEHHRGRERADQPGTAAGSRAAAVVGPAHRVQATQNRPAGRISSRSSGIAVRHLPHTP